MKVVAGICLGFWFGLLFFGNLMASIAKQPLYKDLRMLIFFFCNLMASIMKKPLYKDLKMDADLSVFTFLSLDE